MVAPGDVVLVDLTFLLKANEHSFYDAPLLLGPRGEDNTILYGVARDLLRLRKSLGIRNAIVVIGSDATTISSDTTVNNVLCLLRSLRTVVVHEQKSTAGSLCRSLASVAWWVMTQYKTLLQLVSDKCGIILPDIEG